MADVFEKPIHILQPSEDRKTFTVDKSAVEGLKKITGPCVLVSVVGTQRGGKSTLLNLLHNRSPKPGFGLGHYMDPQTTGLWIWCRKHPRNPNLTVILTDTEGLDSPHIPQWYNWTLAALALLVSSFFVYQSKGSIDSSATDRLAVILKVAEQISGPKNSGTDQPNFLWLIRDHQLSFKKAPREEMLGMLDRSEKRALEDFFESSDCFPLPRPVEESKLRDVENMEWGDLREEFREEYAALERQIFSSVSSARQLSGNEMTGELIGGLLEKYVNALSAKGVLSDLSQLPTQRQMVLTMSGERATKSALAMYAKVMKELETRLPVDEEELFVAHEAALKTSSAHFYREVNLEEGDKLPGELSDFYETFLSGVSRWLSVVNFVGSRCVESRELVSGLYFDVIRQNMAISEKRCKQVLSELYLPIKTKLKDITGNFKSDKEYKLEVKQLKEDYLSHPHVSGSSKLSALAAFELDSERDFETVRLALLENRIKLSHQQLEETVFANLETTNASLSQHQQSISALTEKLSSQGNDSKEALSALAAKFAEKHEKIAEKLSESLETVNTKLSSRFDEVSAITRQQATDLMTISSKHEQLASSLSSLSEKLTSSTSSHATTLATLQEGLSTLNATHAASVVAQQLTDTRGKNELEKVQESVKSLEAAVTEQIQSVSSTSSGAVTALASQLAEKVAEIKEKLSTLSSDGKESVSAVKGELKEALGEVAIQEKEARLALKEELGESLRSANLKAQESRDALAATVTSLQSSLTTSLTSLTEKSVTSIDEVKERVNGIDLSVSELRSKTTTDVSVLQEVLEAQVATSRDMASAALAQSVIDADLSVSTLREELSSLSLSVKSTQESHEAKLSEVEATLSSKLAEEIGALQSTVATSEELTTALSSLQTSLTQSLEQQLETALSQYAKESDIEAHALSLKEALSELSTTKSLLEVSQGEVRGVVETTTALQTSLESLEGTLPALSQSVEQLQEKLKESEEKHQEQQLAVSAKLNNLDQVKEALEEAKKDEAGQKNTVASLQGRIETNEQTQKSLLEKMELLPTELQSLKEKLTTLEEGEEASSRRSASLEEQLSVLSSLKGSSGSDGEVEGALTSSQFTSVSSSLSELAGKHSALESSTQSTLSTIQSSIESLSASSASTIQSLSTLQESLALLEVDVREAKTLVKTTQKEEGEEGGEGQGEGQGEGEGSQQSTDTPTPTPPNGKGASGTVATVSSTEVAQLREVVEKDSQQLAVVQGTLNALQQATASTFTNVETNLTLIRDQIRTLKATPPPLPDTATSIVLRETALDSVEGGNGSEGMSETTQRAIASLQATSAKYTDSAVLELHQELLALRQLISASPSASASAEGALARVGQLESQVQTLTELCRDLSLARQGTSGSPPPYGAAPPSYDAAVGQTLVPASTPSFSSGDTLALRKELVSALKMNISQMQEGLRAEFNTAISLLRKELTSSSSTPTYTAPNSLSTSGSDLSFPPSQSQEQENKRMLAQIDQVNSQIDALWKFLGGMSQKFVDLESLIDQV